MKLIDKIKSLFNKAKTKSKQAMKARTDSEFADDEYLGNMNPHCAQDLKRRQVKSRESSACRAKSGSTAKTRKTCKEENEATDTTTEAAEETIIPPLFIPGEGNPVSTVVLPAGNELKPKKPRTTNDAVSALKNPSTAARTSCTPKKSTAKSTPKSRVKGIEKHTRPTNDNYTMIDEKENTVDSSRS